MRNRWINSVITHRLSRHLEPRLIFSLSKRLSKRKLWVGRVIAVPQKKEEERK